MFPSIPPGPASALNTLRFDRPADFGLGHLTKTDWEECLWYCDQNRLTLLWYSAAEDLALPDWVRERLQAKTRANRQRVDKLLSLYREISARLELGGIEHLVLKGHAQWPDFTENLYLRAQYDLDLYCPADSIKRALAVIVEMGFEAVEGLNAFPTDHLPLLVQKTGWLWRGDYFDVDLPIAIELHFRFWDWSTERFGPRDQEAFWKHRIERNVYGARIHTLDSADALAYACEHALRHLVRGDSKPNHMYEIAWFLHHLHDDTFWSVWRGRSEPPLLQIQGVCFLLARLWFGCRLASDAEAAIDALPPAVHSWSKRWGQSPLEAPFRPNKDELWLHLSLVESTADKLAVLRRRLIPLRAPAAVGAIHVPASKASLRRKLLDRWLYVKFTMKRLRHHAALLAPTVVQGLRWWLSRS